MRKFIFSSVSALLLHAQTALAQNTLDIPPVSPTARDIYIGCSLLIRDTELVNATKPHALPYSAEICSWIAFTAFGYSRTIKPGNEWEYCVPENAAWAADPVRTLATVYVESYEKHRFPNLNKQGLTTMLYMFKLNWPCPKLK